MHTGQSMNRTAGRLEAVALSHRGIYLQWPGERHHLDFVDLTGRRVYVYGQTEVTRDLMRAREADGAQIVYGARDMTLHDVGSDRPSLTYTDAAGATHARSDAGAAGLAENWPRTAVGRLNFRDQEVDRKLDNWDTVRSLRFPLIGCCSHGALRMVGTDRTRARRVHAD